MSGLRLLGAHFGVARPDQVLDEHVGRGVLDLVAAVVRNLVFAIGTAASADIGHCRPKVIELTPRLGELVALGALLGLLDFGNAATRCRLHFPLDRFDLESIAGQRIQQRGVRAFVRSPVESPEAAQPPLRWAVLAGHVHVFSYKKRAVAQTRGRNGYMLGADGASPARCAGPGSKLPCSWYTSG